ncbi:Hypothetical predicted protein, partial [Olea europaea subsp. europaea]
CACGRSSSDCDAASSRCFQQGEGGANSSFALLLRAARPALACKYDIWGQIVNFLIE